MLRARWKWWGTGDRVLVYWLDPDGGRVRRPRREREPAGSYLGKAGEGNGTEPRIHVARGAERCKGRDDRLAGSRLHRRGRTLHQHRSPVWDAAHPHDCVLIHKGAARLSGRLTACGHVHEQSRLDMQRLTRRRGIAGRIDMLGRLWIGVTGPVKVMQAIQAEIALWVQSPVRDDPGARRPARGDRRLRLERFDAG
jgi:hypothetical protein